MARGTIHLPVVQGGTIHSRPMPPDHARVTVDAIEDADFIELPLHVSNDEHFTLGSVLGSFTAWPMSKILIGSVEVLLLKVLILLNLYLYDRVIVDSGFYSNLL